MVRLTIVCLVLAGCAPMSEAECRAGNWYALGEQEGLMGLRPRIDLYNATCPRYSVTPSEPAYMAGWAAGASEYNTRVGGSKM